MMDNAFRFYCFLFLITIIFVGCEKDEVALPADRLSVVRFSPLAALPSDTITILGTGFSKSVNANVVQFTYPEGTKVADQAFAKVISANPGELKVVVPANAQIGNVKVGVGPYTALSTVPFLLSPSISSVNPAGGLGGDQITIVGRNFASRTSDLVVYVGSTRIETIFGSSSTQVIFPLPEGLAPGTVQLKIGIVLTEQDTVFAPSVPFSIFDPNKPTVTQVSPQLVLPGAELTINGFALKPAEGTTSIVLTVAGQAPVEVLQTAFIDHKNSSVKFKLPESFAAMVKDKEQIDVALTAKTVIGDKTLISEPSVNFTVKEPSDTEFFYTQLDASGDIDDGLYKAQPISAGNAIKTKLSQANFGVTISQADVFANFGTIKKIAVDGSGETSLILDNGNTSGSDVVVNEAQTEAYYFNTAENILLKFDLAAGTSTTIHSDHFVTHFKFHNNKILWGGKTLFGPVKIVINQTDPATGVTPATPLYSYTVTASRYLTGICVSGNKIYFAEGPVNSTSLSNNVIGGASSTIFSMNDDGTGLKTEHTISGVITDLEVSADGNTLYWMMSGTASDSGIVSAPASGGGIVTPVISGILNGRYFHVLEKD